jgi:hypothetical protein
MAALLRAFLTISLLRSSPEVLPASSALLGLAVLAYALVGVLLAAISLPLGNALLASLLDTLLLLAFGYIVLNLKGVLTRFQQTLTALAGGLTLVGLVSLPITGWLFWAETHEADAGLPSLLLLGVLVWNIMLVAHILRHALDVSLPLALVFSMAYMFVSLGILNWLFVQPG